MNEEFDAVGYTFAKYSSQINSGIANLRGVYPELDWEHSAKYKGDIIISLQLPLKQLILLEGTVRQSTRDDLVRLIPNDPKFDALSRVSLSSRETLDNYIGRINDGE